MGDKSSQRLRKRRWPQGAHTPRPMRHQCITATSRRCLHNDPEYRHATHVGAKKKDHFAFTGPINKTHQLCNSERTQHLSTLIEQNHMQTRGKGETSAIHLQEDAMKRSLWRFDYGKTARTAIRCPHAKAKRTSLQ
jgi:hypothetical protein